MMIIQTKCEGLFSKSLNKMTNSVHYGIFISIWLLAGISPISASSDAAIEPAPEAVVASQDGGGESKSENKSEGELSAQSEPPKTLSDPETHVRRIAETDQSSETAPVTVASRNMRSNDREKARVENITLEHNMAELIHFGKNVSQVFVANPEVADVQLNGSSAAYIFARKPGNTSVFVSDKDGNTLVRLSIRVTHNLKQLRKNLQTAFPNNVINLESTPHGIMISGTASSATVSKDIENLANGFLTKDEKLTNAMTIDSPTQILLKVKIAEVSRNVLNTFGINWAAIGSIENFTYGILTGRGPIRSVLDPSDSGTFPFIRSDKPIDGSARLGSYGFRYKDNNTNLNSLLDALDSETLATVLAEPNLMAVSGETASFLVGGEFPYPVPQQQNITIDFKEYGIRLSFTPTVRDNNKINLRVRPEVSELDRQNAVNIPIIGAGDVSVPGLKTRRAETSVELGNGQSLAIAGLISSEMRNNYNDLPGLGDLPILGALFRSSSFLKGQTELVIIVTPILVEPSSDPRGMSLPTDNIKRASNLEMLLYRRLNRGSDRGVKDLGDLQLVGHAGFNDE